MNIYAKLFILSGPLSENIVKYSFIHFNILTIYILPSIFSTFRFCYDIKAEEMHIVLIPNIYVYIILYNHIKSITCLIGY